MRKRAESIAKSLVLWVQKQFWTYVVTDIMWISFWSSICQSKGVIKWGLVLIKDGAPSNQEKIKQCISVLKGLCVHSRVSLKVAVVYGFNQLFGHLYDLLLSSWNTQRRLACESDILTAWKSQLLINIPTHFKAWLNLCNPQNANLCLESTRKFLTVNLYCFCLFRY